MKRIKLKMDKKKLGNIDINRALVFSPIQPFISRILTLVWGCTPLVFHTKLLYFMQLSRIHFFF